MGFAALLTEVRACTLCEKTCPWARALQYRYIQAPTSSSAKCPASKFTRPVSPGTTPRSSGYRIGFRLMEIYFTTIAIMPMGLPSCRWGGDKPLSVPERPCFSKPEAYAASRTSLLASAVSTLFPADHHVLRVFQPSPLFPLCARVFLPALRAAISRLAMYIPAPKITRLPTQVQASGTSLKRKKPISATKISRVYS